MENLWDKFYDKVICTEPEFTEVGKQFDQEVDKILEPLKETMSAPEIEIIRAVVYRAAYLAQKNGFMLGVSAGVELTKEI